MRKPDELASVQTPQKADHSTRKDEESVAAALNEQGFLLQQQIRETVTQSRTIPWRVLASEYSVTAGDGSQTRIDLVLQNSQARGHFLCVECKRANPKYKNWIFFDQGQSIVGTDSQQIYLETLQIEKRPKEGEIEACRALWSQPPKMPVFNSYLESAVKRNDKDDKGRDRVSATDTIEKAFYQVLSGHTGLMEKVLKFDMHLLYRSIPVVVTTAQMFRAEFEILNVDFESGMLDAKDLSLSPLDFCAVNYHPNDNLSLNSYVRHVRTDVVSDMTWWQLRTVFVVRASAIHKFLEQADLTLVKC